MMKCEFLSFVRKILYQYHTNSGFSMSIVCICEIKIVIMKNFIFDSKPSQKTSFFYVVFSTRECILYILSKGPILCCRISSQNLFWSIFYIKLLWQNLRNYKQSVMVLYVVLNIVKCISQINSSYFYLL